MQYMSKYIKYKDLTQLFDLSCSLCLEVESNMSLKINNFDFKTTQVKCQVCKRRQQKCEWIQKKIDA